MDDFLAEWDQYEFNPDQSQERVASSAKDPQRQWAKRNFGAYNSGSSTTSTPQKRVLVVTVASGTDSEPGNKASPTQARQTKRSVKRLHFRPPPLVNLTDSDIESAEESQEDELRVLRKKIGFESQFYANTVCCSKGYKPLLTTAEGVQLLFATDVLDPVATTVPFMPQDNCIFVIDLTQLKSKKDILSDHLGSWRPNSGCKKYWFKRTGSPVREAKRSTEEEEGDETQPTKYEFKRTLYHHSSNQDYCRLVIQSDSFNYALVQYAFEGERHDIEVLPHGNRRHGDQQYSRVFDSVKTTVKSAGRKAGMESLKEQRKNMEEYQHPAELIRGAKQVRNLTQSQQAKEDIWEIVCKSKLEKDHPAQHFIRDITMTPELVIFLSSERQLDDLVKFCTNPSNFCVLGVDTLFNAGKFLVTVVTYRHLMLKSLRSYSGVHPVMIGAIIIHVGKSEHTLAYLAFLLKKYRPVLRNLRAFGSDEDPAICNAFKDAFADAAQFLCDLHLKDTVKRKMRELNVNHETSTVILQDIFGKPEGDTVVGGLINCASRDYDQELEMILDKWEYKSEEGEKFVNYFRKYKAEQIKKCTLLEDRIAAGMGLNVYTQNANECSNNVLKQALNYEKVTTNEFIEIARDVCFKQEKEVKLAGMSRSERSFLLDEYKHLRIRDPDLYNTAVNPTSSHRSKVMSSIHRGKLLPKAKMTVAAHADPDARVMSSLPQDNVGDTDGLRDFLADLLPAFKGLSKDVEIALISKALRLLQRKDAVITRYPGKSLESAAMVASDSSSVPNSLEFDRVTGKVTRTCAGYQLRKLCAHSLALAVDRDMAIMYKNWFNSNAVKNLDKAVHHGVSPTIGAKLSSTSRRKGPSKETNPVKTVITKSSIYRDSSDCATLESSSEAPSISRKGQSLDTPTASLSRATSPNRSLTFAERPKQVEIRPDAYSYELHFLGDCHSAARKCAGCHKNLHVSGKVGQPPEDIVVVSKIPRTYKKNEEIVMGRMGNAYFHVSISCVKRELQDFDAAKLILLPDVRGKLLPVHYMHIQKIFGVKFS